MQSHKKLPVSPSRRSLDLLAQCAELMIGYQSEEWPQEYLFYHHHRLALDLEWTLSTTNEASKILEIGGNPFFLTRALITAGRNSVCLDIPSESSRAITDRAGLEVIWHDIEKEPIPLPDASFDEILFNEVFEHLRINPIKVLRETLRILRPGGRLWLSTPNLGSAKGIINLALRNEAWCVSGEGIYAQYDHLSKFGIMGHVREYTSKEVQDALLQVGFKQVDVLYRGEYKNRLINAASTLWPRMRPYFSCIAVR